MKISYATQTGCCVFFPVRIIDIIEKGYGLDIFAFSQTFFYLKYILRKVYISSDSLVNLSQIEYIHVNNTQIKTQRKSCDSVSQ